MYGGFCIYRVSSRVYPSFDRGIVVPSIPVLKLQYSNHSGLAFFVLHLSIFNSNYKYFLHSLSSSTALIYISSLIAQLNCYHRQDDLDS